MMKPQLIAVLSALALTAGAWAQNASNPPAISLQKFVFSHPMTVINKVELAVVKKRIVDKVEPQAAAFAKLLSDAEEAQHFKADPPTAIDMDSYDKDTTQNTELRPWLWRNCHAAYASALAYTYTGEKKYADKAIEILDDWAMKNTTFKGNDSGLQLGSWFSPMLYAADLLHDYPGWTPSQRERFVSWWRAKCLPSVHRAMQIRVNNWKDAGLLGVMAAAVAFEDKGLLQEAVQTLDGYYFSPPPETGPKNKRIRKIEKDQRGAYLIAEVTRNDGQSGITYTAYALTTMIQALEIARYAGQDCWQRKTDQGATLQEVIENYFRWDIQEKPFPWNPNPNRLPTRKNTYEIANNHFQLMPEIRDWLKKNRPVKGEQGDEYATLNKGDIPAPDKSR